MSAIASILIPTAAPAGPESQTAGPAGAIDGAIAGSDDGADFSQILQAMLIGAGLLQATPPALAMPQNSGSSTDASSNADHTAASGCGFAGAVQLAQLVSNASQTLDVATLEAVQQVGSPNVSNIDVASGLSLQAESAGLESEVLEEMPLLDGMPPLQQPINEAVPQVAEVGVVDAQTAIANVVKNGVLRTEAPGTIEKPIQDQNLIRDAGPIEAAAPMPESDELILDSLKPTAESGTELRTAVSKKDDESETLNDVGEADGVHGSTHSESTRHVDMEPKPREVASSVSEQVRDRIIDHVETAREHGRVELSFDLHPPELGRMRLNLTSQDHSLSVRLWADSDQARQMLESQMDSLKQRLAEGGISLGSFNVGRDSGGARLPYKPPESFVQSLTSAPADDVSRTITRFRWAAGSGAVDVMA